MTPKPLITRREWRSVLLAALLVIVVTTAPYALAWASQGDDWRFSGFLFGVEDGRSYLGKLRLGARGVWDFYLFYTPEAHDAAPLVFLPYIAPGQVVGLLVSETDPNLTNVLIVTFHVLRVAGDLLLIVVLYRFIAAFARAPGVRFTALVLATLGGGLGWLAGLAGGFPPEFYIPEGFSFLILFGLPHLALARAALLAGLLLVVPPEARSHPAKEESPLKTGKRAVWRGLGAGLLFALVGLCVPFYLVVVCVILAAWGLALWLRRRAFPPAFALRAAIAAALALPLLAYYAAVFSRNPAFAVWSAQNRLPSPPPLDYLLAYVLLVIPALWGLRRAWRLARAQGQHALLVGWVVVVPLLVYLPINVQRRMAEGVIVPLAILAAMGLRLVAHHLAGGKRPRAYRLAWKRARTALLAAASLSSALLLLGSLLAARSPARPLFHPADELTAFDWLNANAAPDSVVLSAVATGNALPAYTGVRPFMGHGPETLFWQAKTAQLERFFRDEMSAAERAALYADFNIRYVFYGPLERALAPDPAETPEWTAGMTRVYDAGGYQIFRVSHEADAD